VRMSLLTLSSRVCFGWGVLLSFYVTRFGE
jgi:hypothetical protein